LLFVALCFADDLLGKPLHTPHQVRGSLFPDHALVRVVLRMRKPKAAVAAARNVPAAEPLETPVRLICLALLLAIAALACRIASFW
jgi:hypothetical protein